MGKVAFHTLGCKVNHYESEAMMDLFKKRGYQVVDFDKKADIYIVNSCTVTNEAARKSRQLARRAKRNNPDAKVALIGCYTQVSPEEVKKVEGVDLVIGTSGRAEIVNIVEKNLKGIERKTDILEWKELKEYEDLKIETLSETTRAYIKIEEGCNQFCSYCIIPYARGPVRSRKIHLVVEEVKKLVAKGVKEVVLTGTHLGAYGYDMEDDSALVNLIKTLIKIENLKHIRLSSLEITEITEELLELIEVEEKVCPHLHIPLQSGSEKILKSMKRPYDKKQFKQGVEMVKEKISDITLTTDIIVGFPGETEKYFQESFDFVKKIGFSRLHVFPFSAREGTPAARMENKIPGNIIKKNSKKMRELNKKLMADYQEKFIGDIREVIIEEKRDYKTDKLTGMTDNYIRVLIDGDNKNMGNLVNVKLVESYDYENAIGKIIS